MSMLATTPSLAVQSALVQAVEALEAAQRPVSRASVTVGISPWDDCCETGGQCYARIDRLYRSDRFPTEGAIQPCAQPTAAQIIIGVARCYPSLAADGSAPPPADETNAALLLYEDALVVWQALADGGSWWLDAVLVQAQAFLSLGGCCAVETTLFVELPG